MPVSDRNKIDYAKSVLRRQYTGADQTSGQLTKGKVYVISNYVQGDDFENVGAQADTFDEFSTVSTPANATGVTFIATDTTPTKWDNGSTLNELKLSDLRTYSATLFGLATVTVTLKSSASEGGSQSGDITFEKVLLGIAVEELIAEFDPNYKAPAPVPGRPIGVTVRLGL